MVDGVVRRLKPEKLVDRVLLVRFSARRRKVRDSAILIYCSRLMHKKDENGDGGITHQYDHAGTKKGWNMVLAIFKGFYGQYDTDDRHG